MEDQPLSPPGFALTAAIFEGSLAFLAVALGWLLEQPPLETFYFDKYAILLAPLLVLPPLLLMVLCMSHWFRPAADIRRVVDELLTPLFQQCTVAEMAIVSILAGVGEEMLFRGVLQAYFARWASNSQLPLPWHGPAAAQWFAVVVTAVLFGWAHCVNRAYAVLAGVVGLYIGWLWMASNSLLMPIITHSLYDFLALLYLVKMRGRSGGADNSDLAIREKFSQ